MKRLLPLILLAALVFMIGCNRTEELRILGAEAAWSPDGQTIAYAHNLEYEGDTGGIWFVNSDGTNPRPFYKGMQVDWSPDGQRLVIANGSWNIYIIDKDSTNFEWLIQDGLSNSPAWSPDGKWVAFVRPFVFDGLDLINLGTKDETVITDASRGDWAPEGNKLCFAYRFNGTLGIGYADISTQEVKQIALLDEDEYGPIIPPPRWSPDGEKIVFQMGSDIWVIDTSGQNLKRLARDAMDPNWSPDGERIIYTAYRDEEDQLWIMNANGRNEHPLGE